jgi:thioredoxin reductase (NADPH)
MTDMLDCLVIGGGPAGLTAAIYLGRFRRRLLVVDKGWSRAAWITHSRNVPGFAEGVAGPALLETMRVQARLYGAVIEIGTIESLRRGDGDCFIAERDGSEILARSVILATGVRENEPPVPHVADSVRSGLIRTCPICDGYECIGKHVAVLGNGEHAAREAIFLRTYTDKLSLLLMATEIIPLSETTLHDLRAAEITVTTVAIGSIHVDDKVTVLGVEDGVTHRFDMIYSAFGIEAQTALAAALGAKMDAEQRIFVNEHQETSVTGLFAAGDLVRGLNQIAVANGEAAIAATAIHNRLPHVFA